MPQRQKELVAAYLQGAAIFSTNLIGKSGFKGWHQGESLSLSESLITENAASGFSSFSMLNLCTMIKLLADAMRRPDMFFPGLKAQY